MKTPSAKAASAAARLLASIPSAARAAAAAVNGRSGGRPWTCDRCGQVFPATIRPGARGRRWDNKSRKNRRWRICSDCQ